MTDALAFMALYFFGIIIKKDLVRSRMPICNMPAECQAEDSMYAVLRRSLDQKRAVLLNLFQ